MKTKLLLVLIAMMACGMANGKNGLSNRSCMAGLSIKNSISIASGIPIAPGISRVAIFAPDSLSADTTKNDTTKTSLLQRLQEKKEQIVQNIQEKIDSLKPKAEEAMIKADSILDVRNAKITTDTLWVARPQETWTFRAKVDGFGEMMHLRSVDPDGTKGNYYLTADPKITLGIMANYRGISASLSLSPSKILSDISDMMSAINYYSNTFGIDLTFEKVNSFRGRSSLLSHTHKLSDATNMRQFALTGYYVFNGKKFSLPAVFNSTWVQKRSAGSFLVQAAFNTGRVKIGPDLDTDETVTSIPERIDMNSFAIGADRKSVV